MRIAVATLAVVAVLAAGEAVADQGEPTRDAAHEGGRIRVWAEAMNGLRGAPATVVRSDGREITLDLAGGARVRVPYAAITRLDLSEGRRRHTVRGAVLGAALVGTTALFVDEIRGRSYIGDISDPVYAALVGAALGAATGTALRSEQWRRVDTSRGVRGGLASAPGVRFTIRF
jgi:hypothetical protein